MTHAKCASNGSASSNGGFADVVHAARQHLCELDEDPSVAVRHVAAFLAFMPTVRWSDDRRRIRVDHAPTALWLAEQLARRGSTVVRLSGDGRSVVLTDPLVTLERFGFRDGRWVFGQGSAATLGISRGAIHAAARFGRRGMTVVCPDTPMMLTLSAVLSRLDVKAKLSAADTDPRLAVGVRDVPVVLDRVGIADIVAQFHTAMEKRP